MLSHFHELYPRQLQLLPILPSKTEGLAVNRKHAYLEEYAPGGTEVGADTAGGIWDPGSYGQYLGGTPGKSEYDTIQYMYISYLLNVIALFHSLFRWEE